MHGAVDRHVSAPVKNAGPVPVGVAHAHPGAVPLFLSAVLGGGARAASVTSSVGSSTTSLW
ncbi:hypothetical protein OG422_14480 [Streptomyces sp. NBC_01525]|uniref:hypothetical protein n=1 Tax=Streptomyces sp. NBC_01525 TaxID=2903893 RepID=UPI0038634EDB